MYNLTLWIAALTLLTIPFQNCASNHEYSEKPAIDLSSLELEAAAKTILSDKCTNCHGAEADDSNLVVDILNLEKMIEDGYIVPGNPQQSQLYLDVMDQLMPPSDPLSTEEVASLKAWIRDIGDPVADATGGAIPELPGDGGAQQEVTFTQIYGNIIANKCVSCHGSAGASGGVRLDGYTNVMRYVTAGIPASSPLYDSVASNRMPTAAPLPSLEKLSIYNWILQGAKNN